MPAGQSKEAESMIRYQASRKRIAEMITAINEGWFDRGREMTGRHEKAGRFIKHSQFWGDIKPAFMEIQHCKCAYCERVLEGAEYGRIEHDLEHFRPKNGVKTWPPPMKRAAYRSAKLISALGAAFPVGYYWLAYDFRNYLTSCKTCNTILKANYFPIAGARASVNAGFPSLREERSYLPYPIGSHDTDPMRLIVFDGVTPVPVRSRGYDRDRAIVTIELFELATRDILLRERADVIWKVGTVLRRCPDEDAAKSLLADSSAHANCARSFARTYSQDVARAAEIYAEAARICKMPSMW